MSLLDDLRIEMQKYNITYYIVPTSDYHNSEYTASYFKSREYLTNFKGSAGTLLVSMNQAFLWVDGRYYIQAANEVDSKQIIIMKQGYQDTLNLIDFLKTKLTNNDILGFDGKVIPSSFVDKLNETFSFNVKIKSDLDLVNNIWKDRPSLPFSNIYLLDDIYSGMTYEEKLNNIKSKMTEYAANIHILSDLCDIAWILNLRGNDIERTPVFLSYLIIEDNNTILFVDELKINKIIKKYLKDNKITIKSYDEFYSYISKYEKKDILIDKSRINYEIFNKISSKNNIINKENPSLLLKSIKNKTEINNIIEAQIKDGVSITKLMYLLKTTSNKEEYTEISIANTLDKFRQKQEGFIDLSFDTICAFNTNGAIVHYKANEETNLKVEGNGLLLLDTGAHYLEGTTDITRTFGIGKISDEMKTLYTNVLKAHIELAMTKFIKGTTGSQLDAIARNELWKQNQDYRHGTGHGVGYLLSVHEDPNRFSPKCYTEIKEGMITTNEPGLYIENKFGCRLENELLCVKDTTNDFGEFLKFETISYVPFDIDCIKPILLTKQEKEWINSYHELVYKKLSKQLTKPERDWLKELCYPIK